MNARYTARVLSMAAIAAASAAHGGEGVLEINQDCAVNGGCFPGDKPGFPVQISDSSNPRSYVLTGDLLLPSGVDGIDISIANVSLNLKGFEIRGPESCTGTPVTSCTGSGQHGVGSTAEGTRVVNGSVSGVASSGLTLGPRAQVSDVLVAESGGNAIAVENGSEVHNSTARRNGGDGISASDGVTVKQCRTSGNGESGIQTSQAAVVVGSTARNNAEFGISVTDGSVVRDSVSRDNGDSGVLAFNTSTLVVDSTITDNTNFGVECSFGTGAGLKGLLMSGNNSGGDQYNAGCVEIETNLCGGSTSCP